MRLGWLGLVVTGCALAGDRVPTVRAIEFKNFHGVSSKDIVERLHDRDIEMMSRAYSAQCVETAQEIVQELLVEKGQRGVRVVPTVTRHGQSVRVVFTAAD